MLQHKRKFSLKYRLILILCSGLVPILTLSKDEIHHPFCPALPQNHRDTSQPIKGADTTKIQKVDTVRLKLSKDSISFPVEHKAEDSMVLEVDSRKVLLYGKGEIKYDDIQLNSPKIEYDQQTQFVTADRKSVV